MSVELLEENSEINIIASFSDDLEDIKIKPSYCMGCGDVLRHYSLLICSECLDDNCHNFLKIAQAI